MESQLKPQDTRLFVHIQHSQPVELNEFTASLKSFSNLYSTYVKSNGGSDEMSQAKLYVEKIEEGSIFIYLMEVVSANIIPFLENVNTILGFAEYLKNTYDFYISGIGEKPKLSIQECVDFAHSLDVVAGDNSGKMEIGAIPKENNGNIFYKCNFTSIDSNGFQNKIGKEVKRLKEVTPDTKDTYKRVLMVVYQIRNDNTGKGNKAIIDDIFKGRKVNLLFATDELEEQILHSDDNPTKKAFQVDIEVQMVNEKLAAYKVTALHDIIDLEE